MQRVLLAALVLTMVGSLGFSGEANLAQELDGASRSPAKCLPVQCVLLAATHRRLRGGFGAGVDEDHPSDPGHPAVAVNRGKSHCFQKRDSAAMMSYARLLEAARGPESSEAALRRALNLDPGNPGAAVHHARVLCRAGRAVESAHMYARALAGHGSRSQNTGLWSGNDTPTHILSDDNITEMVDRMMQMPDCPTDLLAGFASLLLTHPTLGQQGQPVAATRVEGRSRRRRDVGSTRATAQARRLLARALELAPSSPSSADGAQCLMSAALYNWEDDAVSHLLRGDAEGSGDQQLKAGADEGRLLQQCIEEHERQLKDLFDQYTRAKHHLECLLETRKAHVQASDCRRHHAECSALSSLCLCPHTACPSPRRCEHFKAATPILRANSSSAAGLAVLAPSPRTLTARPSDLAGHRAPPLQPERAYAHSTNPLAGSDNDECEARVEEHMARARIGMLRRALAARMRKVARLWWSSGELLLRIGVPHLAATHFASALRVLPGFRPAVLRKAQLMCSASEEEAVGRRRGHRLHATAAGGDGDAAAQLACDVRDGRWHVPKSIPGSARMSPCTNSGPTNVHSLARAGARARVRVGGAEVGEARQGRRKGGGQKGVGELTRGGIASQMEPRAWHARLAHLACLYRAGLRGSETLLDSSLPREWGYPGELKVAGPKPEHRAEGDEEPWPCDSLPMERDPGSSSMGGTEWPLPHAGSVRMALRLTQGAFGAWATDPCTALSLAAQRLRSRTLKRAEPMPASTAEPAPEEASRSGRTQPIETGVRARRDARGLTELANDLMSALPLERRRASRHSRDVAASNTTVAASLRRSRSCSRSQCSSNASIHMQVQNGNRSRSRGTTGRSSSDAALLQARSMLRTALASAPKDPVVLTACARLCWLRGRVVEAALVLSAAASLDPIGQARPQPGWARAALSRGMAALMRGDGSGRGERPLFEVPACMLSSPSSQVSRGMGDGGGGRSSVAVSRDERQAGLVEGKETLPMASLPSGVDSTASALSSGETKVHTASVEQVFSAPKAGQHGAKHQHKSDGSRQASLGGTEAGEAVQHTVIAPSTGGGAGMQRALDVGRSPENTTSVGTSGAGAGVESPRDCLDGGGLDDVGDGWQGDGAVEGHDGGDGSQGPVASDEEDGSLPSAQERAWNRMSKDDLLALRQNLTLLLERLEHAEQQPPEQLSLNAPEPAPPATKHAPEAKLIPAHTHLHTQPSNQTSAEHIEALKANLEGASVAFNGAPTVSAAAVGSMGKPAPAPGIADAGPLPHFDRSSMDLARPTGQTSALAAGIDQQVPTVARVLSAYEGYAAATDTPDGDGGSAVPQAPLPHLQAVVSGKPGRSVRVIKRSMGVSPLLQHMDQILTEVAQANAALEARIASAVNRSAAEAAVNMEVVDSADSADEQFEIDVQRLEEGDPRLELAHKAEEEVLSNASRLFDDDVREIFRLGLPELPPPPLALGAPTVALGVPTVALGAPTVALGAPIAPSAVMPLGVGVPPPPRAVEVNCAGGVRGGREDPADVQNGKGAGDGCEGGDVEFG